MTDNNLDLDLDAIEQEHAATSPGEWTLQESEGECMLMHHEACPRGLEECDDRCPECDDWETWSPAGIDGTRTVNCGDYDSYTDADMRFCVHAHQYVPALIAEVRWLRTANAELRGLVKEASDCAGHNYAPSNVDICHAWWDYVHESAVDICTCWYGEWRARADKALEEKE